MVSIPPSSHAVNALEAACFTNPDSLMLTAMPVNAL
jgi:hypothetical protein